MVKGEAMTVVWHVDDLKVSHKGPFEVTNFSQYLLKIYRNKVRMQRKNIHDYIGMDLKYSKTMMVNVFIIIYLHKLLDYFTKELRGTSSTPAVDHML